MYWKLPPLEGDVGAVDPRHVVLEDEPSLEEELAQRAPISREVWQVVHLDVVDHKMLSAVTKIAVSTEKMSGIGPTDFLSNYDIPGENLPVLNKGIVSNLHFFRNFRFSHGWKGSFPELKLHSVNTEGHLEFTPSGVLSSHKSIEDYLNETFIQT